MQLIVGLGNPGRRYARTRHNIGFRVLDELADRWRVRFRTEARDYELATAERPEGTIWLLKPLTYMNLSGRAVTAWSRENGFSLRGSGSDGEDGGDVTDDTQRSGLHSAAAMTPLVVCDDLALPLGSLRIRARGSAGGQKGLASIIRVVGSDEVPRLRLGIAGAGGEVRASDWSDYVLESFLPDERDAVEDMVERAATAVVHLLSYGVADAASRFNRRVKPA